MKIAGLSAVSETLKNNLTDEDDFCIIGCDGLWEAVTPQEAVKRVMASLQRHGSVKASMYARAARYRCLFARLSGSCYGDCSEELVEYAVHRSSDNVTGIIIGFHDTWPTALSAASRGLAASSISRFELQQDIDTGKETARPAPAASPAAVSSATDLAPLPPPSANAWRPRFRVRVADKAKETLRKALSEAEASPPPDLLQQDVWRTPAPSPSAEQ